MAFPGTNLYTLNDAFTGLRMLASQIRQQSLSLRSSSAAGPTGFPSILAYLQSLKAQRAKLATLAAVPGLAAYAQAQLGNSIDIAAEYTAMLGGIDGCVTWMITNIPKDGSSYLLGAQMDGSGNVTDRTFTSAELAGFRTQLDALIATISG